MAVIDIEALLISIIVFLSYLLPSSLWLLQLYDKSQLAKINGVLEFKKRIWFFKEEKPLTLSEIKSQLEQKEQKAKKRLRVLFMVVLPVICFDMNVILIKHAANYYIKSKFNYDMPPTSMFVYTLTLILLSLWACGVLLNKLFINRVNVFLKKSFEFENQDQ